MKLSTEIETSYSPVAWDYREVIENEKINGATGKVFYFCQEGICEDQGRILDLIEIDSKGLFIVLDNDHQIRIDLIITLFGKPGAAYDKYDAFSNSCMECHGGDN